MLPIRLAGYGEGVRTGLESFGKFVLRGSKGLLNPLTIGNVAPNGLKLYDSAQVIKNYVVHPLLPSSLPIARDNGVFVMLNTRIFTERSDMISCRRAVL